MYPRNCTFLAIRESLYPRKLILSHEVRESLSQRKFIPAKVYTNKVFLSYSWGTRPKNCFFQTFCYTSKYLIHMMLSDSSNSLNFHSVQENQEVLRLSQSVRTLQFSTKWSYSWINSPSVCPYVKVTENRSLVFLDFLHRVMVW